MDGAIAAIKKSGKKIDVQSIASGPTVNEELSRIRSFYLGHQDLKGMFAVDAGSTQGVGEVMQQFNLPSKGVHAGGYDLLPKTLELIQAGSSTSPSTSRPICRASTRRWRCSCSWPRAG